MGIHILDDVANVAYAVRFAPIADLPGKVLPVQPGYRVHIGIANERSLLPQIRPQSGDVGHRIIAQCLFHHFQHFRPPGIGHTWHTQLALVHTRVAHVAGKPGISQRRLVREKALNGVSKILLIAGIVGLIHRIDQHPDRLLGKHIDVVCLFCQFPGLIDKEHTPKAFRHSDLAEFVVDAGAEIQHLIAVAVFTFVGSFVCKHTQKTAFFRLVCHQKGIFQRTSHIDMTLTDIPSALTRVEILNMTCGIAGGEMVIIQNPHLHIPLLGLLQDPVHIPPPAGAYKVVVGTAFHAKSSAAAIIDPLYLLGDCVIVISVKPVKGQHKVCFLSLQHIIKLTIHTVSPYKDLCFFWYRSTNKEKRQDTVHARGKYAKIVKIC